MESTKNVAPDKEFGQLVRKARREHFDNSRERMAWELGVSFATIRRWEAGGLPEVYTLMELCSRFGWDMNRGPDKVMHLVTSRAKPKRTQHQTVVDTPKALGLVA